MSSKRQHDRISDDNVQKIKKVYQKTEAATPTEA
jgi:hypothetical protein